MRAPIVDTQSILGKRAIGFELPTDHYAQLTAEAKHRNLSPGALSRILITNLTYRPDLIATILDER